jgi:glucose/arabinose dehydrogenase
VKLLRTMMVAMMAGLAVPSFAHAIEVEDVAVGLDHPWSVAFLPDGDFLVTERSGQLLRISPDGQTSQPIAGVPEVLAQGQGGLLDIALSPDFAESGVLFLSYAYGSISENGTALMRARLEGDSLVDTQTIFRAKPKRGPQHFGGRMALLDDGTILLTIGDGFAFRENAQNVSDHLGTIVRVAPDGSVPKDNPFANDEAAEPEIWSHGHRNPQAILVDPANGRVWAHEHGPRGGDELNIIRRGGNYGWPILTGGVDYSGARISPYGLDRADEFDFDNPVHVWTPSIAPGGMTLYDGDAFPEWRGNLFVSALAGTALHRLVLEDDKVFSEEVLLDDLGARMRDVRTGPDGFLYILTDASDGKLLRVKP